MDGEPALKSSHLKSTGYTVQGTGHEGEPALKSSQLKLRQALPPLLVPTAAATAGRRSVGDARDDTWRGGTVLLGSSRHRRHSHHVEQQQPDSHRVEQQQPDVDPDVEVDLDQARPETTSASRSSLSSTSCALVKVRHSGYLLVYNIALPAP